MKELENLLGHTTILPKMQCCPTYETDGLSPDCLLAHITDVCTEQDEG